MKMKVLGFLMFGGFFIMKTEKYFDFSLFKCHKLCIDQSSSPGIVINNTALLKQPNDFKYFQELLVKYLK